MTSFDPLSGSTAVANPLSKAEKAAAILLAMGKPVAGKLLKFFEQSELQIIITHAQTLRSVPPDELAEIVNEFEDLFTEGTGLMDNAKMMEGILEESLTPDEIDGLLGRRTAFRAYEMSVWDRLQDSDPEAISAFVLKEHPQTAAYMVSMMPPDIAARILLQYKEADRADILNRTVTMKTVNPRVSAIIEARLTELLEQIEAEKNSTGSRKAADVINEMEKPQVDQLLSALESLNEKSAEKVRPRVFLFDDLVTMPHESRVTLFNDIAGDVIAPALANTPDQLREAVLSSIGARQRRMIEADIGEGGIRFTARDIAIARRSITQEALRLAKDEQIVLREEDETSRAA